MQFKRAAGVLLHPTSLPGNYGIGDFGDPAYRFVDFLEQSRQALWQILPLGPTGFGDSPYQCFSAFAGNVLLISPDKLIEDGYLPAAALTDLKSFPNHTVHYSQVIPFKMALLAKAFSHFQQQGSSEQHQALADFVQDNTYWLEDYALFMALKQKHMAHEGGVWSTWPREIALRQPEAMAAWSEELAEGIAFHKFAQHLFFKQWLALKSYTNMRGIRIVGDIPIFAAYDSADVWANPDLFHLDDTGKSTVIAGVPPDYFSETGQRWGNPLYRWDKMRYSNYAWWEARLNMSFVQADIVRIDHFRGFDAYWEIPAEELTAVVGRWVKGPGSAFFQAIEDKLGELPLIAEDLGVITPEVEALRDQFDFPGMKILQFGFGGEQNSSFLPHNFGRNCVVYTGTHDNETTVGWYHNAQKNERDHVRRYAATSGHDIGWDMIRLAHSSVANTAIIPLQDLLGLGNEARMNFPGKVGGYWSWRFRADALSEHLIYRLRDITELYGRAPSQQQRSGPESIQTENA